MKKEWEKMNLRETLWEEVQILDLLDKDKLTISLIIYKTILNIIRDIKETMYKELKQTMRKMAHQIENINQDRETVKRNHIKILEWKV